MKKRSLDTLKFVFFDIITSPRELRMALNVQKIKEVVEFKDLSIMPDACDNIVGVYNLRGIPVPIIDIISVISNNQTYKLDPSQQTRIIICDLQNTLIGFTVAKTGRTVTCNSSNFLPPPRGGLIKGKKIISGMVMKDESYTPILDLDSILDIIDPVEEQEYSQTKLPSSELFRGKKVLIVEDSRPILKKLARDFAQMGFVVETAENGITGMQKVENNRYDLIFTDIEMPLLDGITMARKIRKMPTFDNVPIIFNSALSNPALINDIESENLGRYIVKYDKDLIIEEVSSAFRKAA